jgi:hypothetical protein
MLQLLRHISAVGFDLIWPSSRGYYFARRMAKQRAELGPPAPPLPKSSLSGPDRQALEFALHAAAGRPKDSVRDNWWKYPAPALLHHESVGENGKAYFINVSSQTALKLTAEHLHDLKEHGSAKCDWGAPLPIDKALLVPRVVGALVAETNARSEYRYFSSAELGQLDARRIAPKTVAVSLTAWTNSKTNSPTDPNLKCGFRMGVRANPEKGSPIPDVEYLLSHRKIWSEAPCPLEGDAHKCGSPIVEYGAWPQGLNFVNYTTHCGMDVGSKLLREASRGSVALRTLWQGMLGIEVAGFAITYRARTEASLIEQILCGGLYKPYSFKFQAADGSLSQIRLDKNRRIKEDVDSPLKKVENLAERKIIFPLLAEALDVAGWVVNRTRGYHWWRSVRTAGLEQLVRSHEDFANCAALYEKLYGGRSIVDLAATPPKSMLVAGITADAMGKRLSRLAEKLLNIKALSPMEIGIAHALAISAIGAMWEAMRSHFDEWRRTRIENARHEAKRYCSGRYAQRKAKESEEFQKWATDGIPELLNDLFTKIRQ